MLLDTLRSMTPARKLYEKYGFVEIASYYASVEDAVYYKLLL
jgi:ribosomal protein S18 acetylase RimI-like enzyme